MKKITIVLSILLTVAPYSTIVAASPDFEKCAQIQDANKRVECYDSVAKESASNKSEDTASAAQAVVDKAVGNKEELAKPEADPSWDIVTKAVWKSFQRTPNMIDSCALKLAHGIPFDTRNDWPAYCNDFRETEIVKDRTKELSAQIKSLKLNAAQRKMVNQGKVWIGASAHVAELSWGRPDSINRTFTASGKREQWVYSGGSYLYVDNGKVTAMQN